MIDSLKNWWKQVRCKHQYEVLYDYIHSSWHPHYGTSKERMYKLYCPYCDHMNFEQKDSFENKKNIEKLKNEIKLRVLGVEKND